MKRYYILFSIVFVIFVTSCSKNNILLKDVTTINYKNVVLIEEDMDDVIDKINNVNFNIKSAVDVLNEDVSPLIIETKTEKYEFVFVDNNICYKQFSDKTGSFLCGKDKEIESILNSFFDEYTNENFNINYNNNYTKSDGIIVKYEETDQSIIIELNEEVISVSIYKAELDSENNIISGDIIYNGKNLNEKIIVKTTPPEVVPKMLIRIINKYGVNFVYIPTYNGRTGEIDFYSPISQ